LQPFILRNVKQGSALYTDALLSYQGLEADYAHQVIDHAVAYVDGNVHTNTLENFWSLLKRGISGTYVSVEPFHFQAYVNEQAFPLQSPQASDAQRSDTRLAGKRLTLRTGHRQE